MKHRVFTVDQADGGTFRFLADSKELAIDHVWSLNRDDSFPACIGTPRQIGWAQDVAGLDLDDETTWN